MTRTMTGVINFWNQGAERLYGWRKEEAIGRVSHDLLQTQFPKPLEDITSELVRNGQWEGELVHTTRDGSHLTIHSRWRLDPSKRSETVVEMNAHSPCVEDTKKPASKVTVFADVVLLAGFATCLAMFLYVVYFYNISGAKNFASQAGIILYQVVPAVAALLLLVLLQLPSRYRINAALLVCSLGISLYSAEFLLNFLSSMSSASQTLWGDGRFDESAKKDIVALAKRHNTTFDFRTKADVIRDLRKQDIHAVPTIIPAELLKEHTEGTFKSEITVDGAEVMPIGGISNRVTVLCNELGKYAIYESDERGFHNPKGIWEANPIPVAAVGDSFTQGSCVPSDKNFMALIRNQYPNTLNLGMSGDGPMVMLAALTEYLPALKPKVVLWFFYEGNDFKDFVRESKSPLLRKYLNGNFVQGLFERQPEIDQALIQYVERYGKRVAAKNNQEMKDRSLSQSLVDSVRLSRLRRTLGLVYGQAAESEDPYAQAQLDLFRAVLLRAKNSVGAWGGTLYFVYLPDRDRYANGEDYHRRSILAAVEEAGLPIIDVHARFQIESDPMSLFPFGRFGHYNEQGHRAVAEEVLRIVSGKS